MTDIELFKTNLYQLFENASDADSMALQKKLRGDFPDNNNYDFSKYLNSKERLHIKMPRLCREIVHKAVVRRFNETKSWNCLDAAELYHKIRDRQEANTIVNSVRIRDTAVGSGLFLVVALHEIICMKSDLKILQDRSGQRLRQYRVEVVKDELIVKDKLGKLFIFNPSSRKSRRIQETLFHEKQTLLGGCLFGRDDNPKLVEICRLRLWIELLKSAYYMESPSVQINASPLCYVNNEELREEYKPRRRLVQLPDIVNIKCCNLPDCGAS